MSANKYKILKNDTITIGNVTLYRIQALTNFAMVKEGSLGGYIEKTKNLSQEGNCWIFDNAKVYGNAKVYENGCLYDESEAFDNAEIFGNAALSAKAKVFGYAKVYDNAVVYDNGQVGGNKEINGEAEIFTVLDALPINQNHQDDAAHSQMSSTLSSAKRKSYQSIAENDSDDTTTSKHQHKHKGFLSGNVNHSDKEVHSVSLGLGSPQNLSHKPQAGNTSNKFGQGSHIAAKTTAKSTQPLPQGEVEQADKIAKDTLPAAADAAPTKGSKTASTTQNKNKSTKPKQPSTPKSKKATQTTTVSTYTPKDDYYDYDDDDDDYDVSQAATDSQGKSKSYLWLIGLIGGGLLGLFVGGPAGAVIGAVGGLVIGIIIWLLLKIFKKLSVAIAFLIGAPAFASLGAASAFVMVTPEQQNVYAFIGASVGLILGILFAKKIPIVTIICSILLWLFFIVIAAQ